MFTGGTFGDRAPALDGGGGRSVHGREAHAPSRRRARLDGGACDAMAGSDWRSCIRQTGAVQAADHVRGDGSRGDRASMTNRPGGPWTAQGHADSELADDEVVDEDVLEAAVPRVVPRVDGEPASEPL